MNLDPQSTGEISDVARAMMRQGIELGLECARDQGEFLPFLMTHGDKPLIQEFMPEAGAGDPTDVAVGMANDAINELPAGVPFVIARDGYFNHPELGRSEAVIVEFGRTGGIESHYALQRYGRSAILKRFRRIGKPIRLPGIVTEPTETP